MERQKAIDKAKKLLVQWAWSGKPNQANHYFLICDKFIVIKKQKKHILEGIGSR